MESLVIVAAVIAVIAAFEILANRFGRDSRDGDDWIIHERAVR